MQLDTELIPIAERVLNFLKLSRERGQITPDNPISSTGIVEAAAKYKVKIKREDIYHIVHYLREKQEPISSSQTGYFYALNPEELKPAICEQVKIIRERQETLTLLKRIQDNLSKSTNSLFDSPVAQVLNDGLELEPFQK